MPGSEMDERDGDSFERKKWDLSWVMLIHRDEDSVIAERRGLGSDRSERRCGIPWLRGLNGRRSYLPKSENFWSKFLVVVIITGIAETMSRRRFGW